jgi:hypothetical protein
MVPAPSPQGSPADGSSPEEQPTEKTYEAVNIKGMGEGPWSEGVDGDGIGENLTLTVHKPKPLDAILIRPGYHAYEATLWAKNNRVAELEITLNGEHSFTVAIPDQRFTEPYPIPIRGYSKPVSTVKLVIKKVHPGTHYHDTCISLVELRVPLSKKPEIQGAR